jgi:hypothetical protein
MQFFPVENGLRFTHGIQQSKRRGAACSSARANHGHERNEAGTPSYQLDWLRLFRAPDEPAADRTTQLQTVTGDDLLCEIRRDFAVWQPFDGDFNSPIGIRRGGDRIPIRIVVII